VETGAAKSKGGTASPSVPGQRLNALAFVEHAGDGNAAAADGGHPKEFTSVKQCDAFEIADLQAMGAASASPTGGAYDRSQPSTSTAGYMLAWSKETGFFLREIQEGEKELKVVREAEYKDMASKIQAVDVHVLNESAKLSATESGETSKIVLVSPRDLPHGTTVLTVPTLQSNPPAPAGHGQGKPDGSSTDAFVDTDGVTIGEWIAEEVEKAKRGVAGAKVEAEKGEGQQQAGDPESMDRWLMQDRCAVEGLMSASAGDSGISKVATSTVSLPNLNAGSIGHGKKLSAGRGKVATAAPCRSAAAGAAAGHQTSESPVKKRAGAAGAGRKSKARSSISNAKPYRANGRGQTTPRSEAGSNRSVSLASWQGSSTGSELMGYSELATIRRRRQTGSSSSSIAAAARQSPRGGKLGRGYAPPPATSNPKPKKQAAATSNTAPSTPRASSFAAHSIKSAGTTPRYGGTGRRATKPETVTPRLLQSARESVMRSALIDARGGGEAPSPRQSRLELLLPNPLASGAVSIRPHRHSGDKASRAAAMRVPASSFPRYSYGRSSEQPVLSAPDDGTPLPLPAPPSSQPAEGANPSPGLAGCKEAADQSAPTPQDQMLPPLAVLDDCGGDESQSPQLAWSDEPLLKAAESEAGHSGGRRQQHSRKRRRRVTKSAQGPAQLGSLAALATGSSPVKQRSKSPRRSTAPAHRVHAPCTLLPASSAYPPASAAGGRGPGPSPEAILSAVDHLLAHVNAGQFPNVVQLHRELLGKSLDSMAEKAATIPCHPIPGLLNTPKDRWRHRSSGSSSSGEFESLEPIEMDDMIDFGPPEGPLPDNSSSPSSGLKSPPAPSSLASTEETKAKLVARWWLKRSTSRARASSGHNLVPKSKRSLSPLRAASPRYLSDDGDSGRGRFLDSQEEEEGQWAPQWPDVPAESQWKWTNEAQHDSSNNQREEGKVGHWEGDGVVVGGCGHSEGGSAAAPAAASGAPWEDVCLEEDRRGGRQMVEFEEEEDPVQEQEEEEGKEAEEEEVMEEEGKEEGSWVGPWADEAGTEAMPSAAWMETKHGCEEGEQEETAHDASGDLSAQKADDIFPIDRGLSGGNHFKLELDRTVMNAFSEDPLFF